MKAALEVICQTTEALAAKAIEMGADGVFMASQMSNYATSMAVEPLTAAEYLEYGKPYDVRVLNAANNAGGWMNTIHCHGDNIMFDILKDYPCLLYTSSLQAGSSTTPGTAPWIKTSSWNYVPPF